MFEVCPYNFDRPCSFCGKNGLGDLYCGVIPTKAGKIPNRIEAMLKKRILCPLQKKIRGK